MAGVPLRKHMALTHYRVYLMMCRRLLRYSNIIPALAQRLLSVTDLLALVFSVIYLLDIYSM